MTSTVLEGQRFRCTNPICGCEMIVEVSPKSLAGERPHCVCGAPMKKPYTPPMLQRLSREEARRRLKTMGID